MTLGERGLALALAVPLVVGCGLLPTDPLVDPRLADGCAVGGSNRLVTWFSLERALDYHTVLPNLRAWHSLQASTRPALVAVFHPPYRDRDGAAHDTRTICAVLIEADGDWDRSHGPLAMTGVSAAEIAR